MNLAESITPPVPPPVPPPMVMMPHYPIKMLAMGMQAHYLAYITGTTREMAISAVEQVWSVHSTETPTLGATYDMLTEAVDLLIHMDSSEGGHD